MATPTARRRAGALTAGAAALTLGLAACGGTGDSAGAGAAAGDRTPLQVVNASVEKSSQAQTAKFALTAEASGDGKSGSVSAEGAFDSAAEAVEMRMTVEAPGVEGLQPAVRIVGGQLYVSGVPGVEAQKWVQVPLDHAGDLGMDTSQLDPSAQLEQLRAVAGDVREIGTETVRGVEAQGYAGTIDLQKAIDLAATPEERAEAQRGLEASGVKEVPFELYVDSEDRPVRVVVSVDATKGAETGSADVSVDYYDWGSPVTVTAPPADAIVEAPAMDAPAADAPAAQPAA